MRINRVIANVRTSIAIVDLFHETKILSKYKNKKKNCLLISISDTFYNKF